MDILDALTNYALARGEIEDYEAVTDWSEETEYGGYCSTCYYAYAVVDLTVTDVKTGENRTVRIDEPFSDLVRGLS